MATAFRVNGPAVVGEVIDGEAVIMNLATGHYFSALGSGAVIWGAIEAGLSRSEMVELLEARYSASADQLLEALDGFLADLLRHELVGEVIGETAHVTSIAQMEDKPRITFDLPVLTVYTDMEEILLLDPIHDVHEAGWPMPRAAEGPSQ